MKTKSLVVFAVVVSFAAGGYFFHHLKHKKHEAVHISYSVTKPWREDLDIQKEYVAQIKAIQHIELRSYEKGYLEKIFVDEGQSIKKGQKMFQLMPQVLQAEYEKAKAEYNIAEIEYNNTKNLESKQVVSANELALSKAKLDKAKAMMELAQTHLNFATIQAPFDGIMDRFHVRLGSLIEEGELLTELSDNSKVWVYFNVSEADYLDYMQNKKAYNQIPLKLLLPNGKYFSQTGKIDTIEADFNNETGNIAFRASFDNPNNILRHGETGSIVVTEKLNNALVIPQKATFEILDKKYVYILDKQNHLKTQHIVVAHDVPHLYVIQSGLNENDTILSA